jgi:hypothetical protein
MTPHRAGSSRTLRTAFSAAFRAFVYSETEAGASAAWQIIVAEFPGQPEIINYLRKIYLPLADEFCSYGVNCHRNFGLRASSRSESSHWLIKKLLSGRKIDLHTLHGAIKEMRSRLAANYDAQLSDQRRCRPTTKNPRFLGPIFFLISHKAISLIEEQLVHAKTALQKAAAFKCKGLYSLQYGLPCWHQLARILETENPQLQLHLIDRHWWIQERKDLPDELSRDLREQEPLTVPRRRKNNNGPQPVGRFGAVEVASPGDNSVHCEQRHDDPRREEPLPPSSAKPKPVSRKRKAPGDKIMEAFEEMEDRIERRVREALLTASQPPPSQHTVRSTPVPETPVPVPVMPQSQSPAPSQWQSPSPSQWQSPAPSQWQSPAPSQ